MRCSVSVRTLVAAVAAGAMMIVPLATPASAATGGQCTKLSTKTTKAGLTATLSNCTPVAATGGGGGGTFAAATGSSGSLNITITWVKGHGTTKANVKFVTAAAKGKCPAGTTSRITLTGSVLGGTGTAVKTITKGQKISASVCLGKTSDTLEPNTVLKF